MNSSNRFFYTEQVSQSPCSTGLDQNSAGILAYVFGIIFIFIETQNRFVRYCAVQSLFVWSAWMLLFLVLSVLSALPLVGIVFELIRALVSLGFVASIGGLAYMASQGRKVIFPLISKYANEWSDPDA